jgi:hypothetical protein
MANRSPVNDFPANREEYRENNEMATSRSELRKQSVVQLNERLALLAQLTFTTSDSTRNTSARSCSLRRSDHRLATTTLPHGFLHV